MGFTTQKTSILLIIVTVIAIYGVSRYSFDEKFASVLVARCINISSSNSARPSPPPTRAPRDGAFYREADIATWDEDWGKKKCALRPIANLKTFFDYIETPRVRCDTQMMLGGNLRSEKGYIDGDKWLCVDKKYKVTPLKCIVLSFGIGGDWSFEDEVDRKLGCRVFAFDPTIEKENHNRTARISFFNLGIDGFTDTGPHAKKKVDRYANILAGLGLLDSVIDVLKIDVEGSEVAFFEDVFEKTPNLLKNVKMIAMEIHMDDNLRDLLPRHKVFWKYFLLLDCMGFKIWHSAVNPFCTNKVVKGQHRSNCYEIVWVQDREW
ncbi:uncharacterized protein LOC127002815 isoform X2 [Eriocheir sinensis]|nr:uncharacterized protein LOC127002815 isoform X2 [Eriocheir sinensis]XP_050724988.1 uncharacterized protein LOC127002815 isoform X2 [Eriocheir sinensis]